MEFLAGGDLMTHLIREDVLKEQDARFYIAELILAIESVHKNNYIHRDIKPDNVLLDKDGHIKLTDFGLCKHAPIRSDRLAEVNTSELSDNFNKLKSALDKKLGCRRSRKLAYSTVGTPDYIAPEVFSQQGYDETVDWWSVGVILYEMLVGWPPFSGDEPSVTCQKIIYWKKTFHFPKEPKLNKPAMDLITKLMCESDRRLGRNGADEIKAHPFFKDFEWNGVRERKAPYQPNVSSEISNENFDQFDESEETPSSKRPGQRKTNMKVIGYTYKADVEEQKNILNQVLRDLGSMQEEVDPNKVPQPRKTQPV